MKKITCIIILILIIFVSTHVNAKDFDLNLNLYEIEDDLRDYNIKIEYKELLNYIKNGDFKKVLDVFKTNMIHELTNKYVYDNNIMLRLFLICLLSVVVNLFTDNYNYQLCDKILLYFTLCLLIELYSQMYVECMQSINAMMEFIEISIPVYFGVSMIFYDKIPISVYGFFVCFIHIFQWISTNLIFPLQSFSCVCTVLDGVCDNFNFKHIKKQIVGFVRIVLGIYTTFFILGLKITQTISYSSQNVIITGVQFALSKSIPVVGGFLSETAETLFSSVILLHNSIGVSSVVIILLMSFAPFLLIFAVSMLIKLFSSVLISFGNNKLIETVYGFGECMSELSIILVCCSVTFIIGLAIEFISVR